MLNEPRNPGVTKCGDCQAINKAKSIPANRYSLMLWYECIYHKMYVSPGRVPCSEARPREDLKRQEARVNE